MPQPDLARLQTSPETILEWLENNLLKAAHPSSETGRAWVKFVDPPVGGHPQVGVRATGEAIDVYQLSTRGAGPQDSIPAYICNYQPNDALSVEVSNAGAFCFTANMNGCSFGIGAPGSDGTVRVTHANTGGNPGGQRDQIRGAHKGLNGTRILEPATYRRFAPNKNMQATTFGVRSGITWNWYFQSYSADGQGRHTLYGVFPIL